MQSNINLALINKIENLSEEIDQYFNDMTQLVEIKMELADSELSLLSGKLDVLSPLKVLKRGYSITYRLPQNEVGISSRQLKVGDDLRVKFKTGETKFRDVFAQFGDLLTSGDDGVKAVIHMRL